MANQPKNNATITRLFSDNRWTIFALLLLFILYQLGPIITPFLAAAILAYICDPLVDKLSDVGIRKYNLGRTVATVLVMFGLIAFMIGVVLILIPLLQKQSILIAERLPTLIDNFRTQVEPWLERYLGINFVIDIAQIQQIVAEHWQETGNIVSNVLKMASSKGLAFIAMLANLILLPVVLFYILRDWDTLVDKIANLVPRKWLTKTTEITKEIDEVLAQFLRGQLSVMAALSLFYSLGLWIAGLEMALAIGLLAGLLSFVPYLGFAIAFIMAVLLALLQFSVLADIVPVLLVFGIGQVVESYVLTPYLVGERIGLHPVVVILALLAGGQLFGFAGVLLALPISAAIAVGLRHSKESYLNSDAYLK
ncbi:MAG: AI-2E family transporter [Betaproteobacteria bacterium]|nr:AI-2E family transporter [Betaproteobacteria bacterium]